MLEDTESMTRRAMYSHSPAAIFRICAVHDVANQLQSFLVLESHASHIRTDDQARYQEHRSAVFARPMSVMGLNLLVEFIPIARGVEGVFGRRQVRHSLYNTVQVQSNAHALHVIGRTLQSSTRAKSDPPRSVATSRAPRRCGGNAMCVVHRRSREAASASNL
jgi:hypothetical protein